MKELRKVTSVWGITGLCGLFLSCQPGASKTPNGNTPAVRDKSIVGAEVTGPIKKIPDHDILRTCSPQELDQAKKMETAIRNSHASIDSAQGNKQISAVAQAVAAIHACDALEKSVAVEACRGELKDALKTEVKFYDGFRVQEKCKKTEDYLLAHGARPEKGTSQPGLAKPPQVVLTPTPALPPGVPAPVHAGPLKQCSAVEFSNLSSMVGNLDQAAASLKIFGNPDQWKYDGTTLTKVTDAVRSCETLITHHDLNPCEKSIKQSNGTTINRQYTGESLRLRCEAPRRYYYEFVQNKTTLNFKNADLYLDLSTFSTKVFEPDYINEIQGCRVENTSGKMVDYSKGLALVRASRGFDQKMMVLETNDGLLVSCYGLNIDGPFSKREVVRVLNDEGTRIDLVYKLR